MPGELETATGALLAARRELEARLAAIDAALEALDENAVVNLPSGHMGAMYLRKTSVGDDKLAAVLQYIRDARGVVRQAEIAPALGVNSGTVSTALHALELDGKVEPGPKLDRSRTWQLAQAPHHHTKAEE